jgi:hypothetical protein
MMEELEHKLKDLILNDVDFTIDGKSIKKGKIKIFNTKQFFIKFKIENDGVVKEWELPYPYRLQKTDNGYLFDYCLSAFCPPTETVFYKMKLMDKKEASKLHDNYLYATVMTLSA